MTLDIWEDSLVKAIDIGSSHISVYDLQIEEKTAFGRWCDEYTFNNCIYQSINRIL